MSAKYPNGVEVVINAQLEMLPVAVDSHAEVVSDNTDFKHSNENRLGRQVCELAAKVAEPLKPTATGVFTLTTRLRFRLRRYKSVALCAIACDANSAENASITHPFDRVRYR